jgi:hypothetical protein
MFVHDFVSVNRPAIEVLDEFFRLEPTLGPTVLAAWNVDRELWSRTGDTWYLPTWPVHIEVGEARVRPDAVVIPLRWHSGESDRPIALEADLEIAAFGAGVTHLHLLGRYAFGAGIAHWAAETSQAHRAMVVAVRRFLQLLADQIAPPVHGDASMPSDSPES